MSVPDLSAAERELLLTLGEEQARYDAREGWDFSQTLWARVTYRMAHARGRLTPTHMPGKFNMDRGFEATFRRLVMRLGKRGLLRYRPIGGGAPRPRQTLGYRSHEARVRDIFLTDRGRAVVAALRAAPPAPAAAPVVPAPDGDVGGAPVRARPAVPRPDGDRGYPEQATPEAAPQPSAPAAPTRPLQTVELEPVDVSAGAHAPQRRPRRLDRPRAARTPRGPTRVRPSRPRLRRAVRSDPP